MYNLSAENVEVALTLFKGDVKFLVKHIFHLPKKEDWVSLLRGRNFIGYTKGATFETANLSQEEDEKFWDSLIDKVEGYTSGKVDIMTLENWKEMIPLQHKLEAISTFFVFNREKNDVEAVVGNGFDLADSVGEDLKFMAIVNGKDEYVTFRFKSPEPSDYIRYNRMSSKMQMVRTKQRGVNAIKTPFDVNKVIELFDKLILSVEGYQYQGESVMKQVGWCDLIPVFHKREALREVFSVSQREENEGEIPLE